MHRQIRTTVARCLALAVLIATTGCNDEATKIAREASDRQAAQNQQMAELQHEVARGTREMVKSDAEAREQFVGVHRDLQQERKQLGESWNELEFERQRVGRERRIDSAWQSLVTFLLGSLVAAAFFAYLRQLLISAQRDEPVDTDVAALLVDHLMADTLQTLENAASHEPLITGQPPAALPPTQHPTPSQERTS
jgi:hypothetical protein